MRTAFGKPLIFGNLAVIEGVSRQRHCSILRNRMLEKVVDRLGRQIDVATQQVVSTVPVGNRPNGIVYGGPAR